MIMNKRYILSGVISLLLANPAYAATLNCATPPTCKELGYTQKVSDCSGKAVVRCPLDLTNDSAVFCGGCASGYILINGTCTRAYSSCWDAGGYISESELKCSDCINGDVAPIIFYNTNGAQMKCWDQCCASDSSTACGDQFGLNDRNKLFDSDHINMLAVNGCSGFGAPSLRNITAKECYDRYLAGLSSIEDDDFAVYAG